MKILWLCNNILPVIAREIGEEPSPFGGWFSGLLDSFINQKNVHLAICFPYNKAAPLIYGTTQSISYYGYLDSKENTKLFCQIIEELSPDVIHIWGTEFKHSLDMVNAAELTGRINRVVINIQGLVSIISKYHFYCALPKKVCRAATIKEIIKKSNIEHQRRIYAKRGKYEIEAIKKVSHVIGRTDWDEACTKQINPLVKYHFCNESLRDSFYKKTWRIDSCQKHSIFVSQSAFSIKGFHLVLEALPLILQRFPDTHLFAIGREPYPNTLKNWLRQGYYQKYLCNLIEKNNLKKHITFLGQLDENGMCEQYLRTNVFLSPSSIENESNSISEAKILGMPVVASFVGGVTNRIEHNIDGFLYQYDAPYMLAFYICKVFEDDQRAIEIGRVARESALRLHDREKNLRDMIAIYESIISG